MKNKKVIIISAIVLIIVVSIIVLLLLTNKKEKKLEIIPMSGIEINTNDLGLDPNGTVVMNVEILNKNINSFEIGKVLITIKDSNEKIVKTITKEVNKTLLSNKTISFKIKDKIDGDNIKYVEYQLIK